ncbi:hypothetical protein QBZ16_003240 [Prototheca wickerhamii]|uniref:HECT-type E3 ubiquitin transferase n=1 Tax=Prototheca wickerhamii TaxID=3111 RepID=A0AAD9IJK6_PROWI|nr:hypothetical protein QBZ16_003240 [Prototheca wickerhamii]
MATGRGSGQGWDLGRAVGPLLDPDSPSSRCFTLFAMVHHHLLQVVDDLEFYEECGTGGVFSLDEHRAIAAVCNSLVVRGLLAQGRGQKASLPRSKRLPDALRAAAALQAALHDRDARRSFAGADLWLAPLIAAGMRPEHLVEPAVLRALDAQTDAAAEVRDDVTALDPSSDSQPVSTPAAALAALVRIAPQCVPFEARVELLRALIRADRARLRLDLPPAEGGPFPVEFRVRRSHLREDGAGALLRLGESVKRRLSVQFVDAHGLPEAGIDMGGLQKEFLERFVAAVTDLRCGLFAQSGAAVFPSPLAGELEGGWPALEAAGVALGKALHEGVLLEVPLAPFFVRRLQGRAVPSEELHSLDADLYRSLLQLKTLDAATVDALDLDFTVESDHFGRKTCEELVPGGARVAVTAANRLQYIHCLAHWHLSRRLGPSAEVFTRGLKKVIPVAWLRLFTPAELNQLLGGGQSGRIDVDDLRRHTEYSGGYTERSSAVKAFWSCLEEMTAEERAAVLKFATSTSRPPLGGFQHLVPPFTIHKVASSASPLAIFGARDVDRLPTASTCTNTLKLPDFRRRSTLREKLLYAVQSGAGFDLS